MDDDSLQIVETIKKENYWIAKFCKTFGAVEIPAEPEIKPESDHNVPRWLQELTPPPF